MCVISGLYSGLVDHCTCQSIPLEDELVDYSEQVRPQVCNASDE